MCIDKIMNINPRLKNMGERTSELEIFQDHAFNKSHIYISLHNKIQGTKQDGVHCSN